MLTRHMAIAQRGTLQCVRRCASTSSAARSSSRTTSTGTQTASPSSLTSDTATSMATAAAVAAKPVYGARYRAPVFTQTVVLSDGATISRLTTSPRSSVRLTRDVRNNPLWNPSLTSATVGEETGRLARFRDRFAGFDAPSKSDPTWAATAGGSGTGGGVGASEAEDQLDWLVDAGAAAAPKISEREAREASRGSKSIKKK